MLDGFVDFVLEKVPLWGVAILLILLCLAARRAGVWVRQRFHPQSPAPPESAGSDPSDYIVGAIFGLLAFMMGFTFAMAMDRYSDRRTAVREEADALRTTYLTASVLDQPSASRTQYAVRQYAHSRIAPEGLWNDRTEAALNESHALGLRAWQEIRAAILPIRDTDLATYLVETTNEAISQGRHREILGRTHLPVLILDLLLVYTIVAAGVLGYIVGPERRGARHASTALLVLYTAALIVIIDLDRPQEGMIKISQQPILDVVGIMDADRDGSLSRPPPAPPN
ncbi:hypothetical protein GCM10023264_12600 [Sphingomonas daechungensis]|uniref:DUF4239 domain-containing protein n=1 Tax=Sphingomonas daechungensis TaxID=1176646 RepID=A0ABX6T3V1_9SPHN|nr:hypothetical protein [Sphingomonas daechungensis]QNP42333.1 hypothetical protein H9L15_08260 [Sphingomonas daechungensis]